MRRLQTARPARGVLRPSGADRRPGGPHGGGGLSALRLLTGWLHDMTSAEAAATVGMDRDRLQAVLHQRETLTPDENARIRRMLELNRHLRMAIKQRAMAWWYRTEDPELGGQSPLEALAENYDTGISRLEKVVDGYFEMSYS